MHKIKQPIGEKINNYNIKVGKYLKTNQIKRYEKRRREGTERRKNTLVCYL